MTIAIKEFLKKASILHLTLKRQPYDVMISGEKKIEIRKPSEWLMSRLVDKNGKKRHYDFICFKNGYNMDSDFFYTEYLEFYFQALPETIAWSNGLMVDIKRRDVIIRLGAIKTLEDVVKFIEEKNIKQHEETLV